MFGESRFADWTLRSYLGPGLNSSMPWQVCLQIFQKICSARRQALTDVWLTFCGAQQQRTGRSGSSTTCAGGSAVVRSIRSRRFDFTWTSTRGARMSRTLTLLPSATVFKEALHAETTNWFSKAQQIHKTRVGLEARYPD